MNAQCRTVQQGMHLGGAMLETKDIAELITRYETLRLRLQELDEQAERLDREIAEMEQLLPEEYVYPGDAALAPKRPR